MTDKNFQEFTKSDKMLSDDELSSVNGGRKAVTPDTCSLPKCINGSYVNQMICAHCSYYKAQQSL